MMRLRILLLGLGALLFSCCALQASEPVAGPVCTFKTVRFEADFPMGRLHDCQQTGRNAYTLRFAPEDWPVNPSAWYAFRAVSDKSQRLAITLRYTQGKHRYWPKTGNAPIALGPMPKKSVTVDDERQWARLRVRLKGGEALYIAGQPLLDGRIYDSWLLRQKGLHPEIESVTVGESVEGRPLNGFVTPGAEEAPVLMVIGRLHPPEVTGVYGLFAFMDRVMGPDELATRFRARYRIAVLPNLNPDGVYHGHWRHNVNGVDLNRDWGPFTQPETQAVLPLIQKLAGPDEDRIKLFLDFHSTREDVFYTQPDPEDGPGFTAKWIAAINARQPGYEPRRNDEHNPGNGVAKNWMHDTYGIPAITYEFGDETPPATVYERAQIAAEEAMKLLLEAAE